MKPKIWIELSIPEGKNSNSHLLESSRSSKNVSNIVMERNTEPTDENQVPYNQFVICHVTGPPSILYLYSNTQDNDHLHRLISTLLMPAIKYRNVTNTYVNNVLNTCSNPWTEPYTIRDFQNMWQWQERKHKKTTM
jgi:hypothetical protein